MRNTAFRTTAIVFVGVLATGCTGAGDGDDDDDSNVEPGFLGNRCYGNGTCNAGLECQGNVCVSTQASSSGGGSSSGLFGSTSSSGGGGCGGGPGFSTIPSTASVPLHAVWASGPNDIWIGGDDGALLHGDGCSYTLVPSGIASNIISISGNGPANVWAMAENMLLHWEGSTWAPITVDTALEGDFRTVSVTPAGDVSYTTACYDYRLQGTSWVLWDPGEHICSYTAGVAISASETFYGTDDGEIDHATSQRNGVTLAGSPEGVVTDMAYDGQNLWITAGGQLLRYHDGSWETPGLALEGLKYRVRAVAPDTVCTLAVVLAASATPTRHRVSCLRNGQWREIGEIPTSRLWAAYDLEYPERLWALGVTEAHVIVADSTGMTHRAAW